MLLLWGAPLPGLCILARGVGSEIRANQDVCCNQVAMTDFVETQSRPRRGTFLELARFGGCKVVAGPLVPKLRGSIQVASESPAIDQGLC